MKDKKYHFGKEKNQIYPLKEYIFKEFLKFIGLLNLPFNNIEIKKKMLGKITLTVRDFFTDYDNLNYSNYLNLSFYFSHAEDGAVTLVVRELPQEQYLHGFPGSNPGRTASALFLFMKNYFRVLNSVFKMEKRLR